MGEATARPREVHLGGRVVKLGWCQVGSAGVEQLSPSERRLSERGKTVKRRHEFCAGRVAAREAVSALLPGGTSFEVLAREEGPDAGRPFVGGGPENLALSISHSGGWAVAAASFGGPLGIDLEGLELSMEPSFLGEAFAPGELEAWSLPTALSRARTSLAWAAKEAVLKVWGVGLRVPLGAVALRVELSPFVATGWGLDARVETTHALAHLGPPPGRLQGWLALAGDQVVVLMGKRK